MDDELNDVGENNAANCQKLPVAQYGGDPVQFVDFMRDYYMYSKAYGWPEKIMVTRLPLYLKGAARDAYCQLKVAELDTWAHCKDALAEKLVSEDVGRIMRKRFYNRVQNASESVTEFAFELSTLAEKAFGFRVNWGDHIKNILQDQFLTGVKPNIRTALSLADYQDYDELVKKATKIEVNTTMTTIAPTMHYTEMERFQRPQSETSNFREKSNYKPKTFNPPPTRGNRESPKFDRRSNFRQMSPKRTVICFRCQGNGHTANQCRTTLNSEINRESSRKSFKCNNCGRMGHSTRECYALKSRSPSNSPSPQRNRLNFKGQQQCYSCQKFGHIARSCPNNADRFQKPILKKSVRIDNKPVVNAAFASNDDFGRDFEAEMYEMRRKFDRCSTKSGSDSENENLMIFLGKEESERNKNIVENYGQISPIIDDVIVDKGRMLYTHLSNNIENCEQDMEETLEILQELINIKLPVEKWENIMKKCVSSVNLGIQYVIDVQSIMLKIGREIRKNLLLEEICVIIIDDFEEKLTENVSAYCTVKELIQMISEAKRWENVKLRFANQILEKMDAYVVDLGMIPGTRNIITVVEYQEMSKNPPEPVESTLFKQLQSELADKDENRIQIVLNDILNLPAGCERKFEFIRLLIPYLHTVHRDKIKQVMQKFGSELREEKAHFQPLLIKINMDKEEFEYLKLHWCSKVKNVRMKVCEKLNTDEMITLHFNNQELDDDEYLVDCGVIPGQMSEINAIKKVENVVRNWNFENISENNCELMEKSRVLNQMNNGGNVKSELEIKTEELIDDDEDEICKFREIPEISFKVEPYSSFTKVQKSGNNRGLLRIVEQMTEIAGNQNNMREFTECKEFLKGLLSEVYPLWRVKSDKRAYIKDIAEQIVQIYPSIIIEINNCETYNVQKMIYELFSDGYSKNKILVGLAFLIQQMGINMSVDGRNLEQMTEDVARIIQKYMYPFVVKQGGWEFLVIEKRGIQRNSSIPARMGRFSPWLFTMIMMICLVSYASSLTAYDCSQTELGKIYSLVDVAECPGAYPLKLKMDENIPYYVYQESGFRRTTVRECIVKRTTFIFYCGKWSHSSLIDFKSIPRPVDITPENCEAAFQTKEIKINAEIKLVAKKNFIIRESFTVKGKLDQNGDCTGEPYKIGNSIVDKTIIIEEYSTELREFEGMFDEVTGKMQTHPFCDMYSTSCHTGESMLVYKVKVKECNLIQLKKTEFTEITGEQFKVKPDTPVMVKGTINKRKMSPVEKSKTPTVLVTSIKEEGMRFIRKDTVVKCGKTVYETNYKGVYVSKIKIDDAKDDIHVSEIKLSQYFNNKLDFIFHFHTDMIANLYREIILNDCKLNREILRNRMAMVMTNPNIVAPMLIAENGIFARVLGEALYSYKCKEVSVKIMKYDECTNELPVNVNGVLRFMEPITRVLLENGTKPKKLDCGRLLAPLYRLTPDLWISLPDRKQVKEPEKLEMTKLEYLQNFTSLNKLASSGIYSTEEIEDARRNILFPSKRERVITEFVDKVLPNGVGSANYEYLLSPDHYKKATLNTMKNIWGHFLYFGQATAGLLGIYILLTLTKVVITQVLSTYRLYTIFGFSLKLIIGCIPFLAKFLIITHQFNEMDNLKGQVTENGQNKSQERNQRKHVRFRSKSDDSDSTVNNQNNNGNNIMMNPDSTVNSTHSLLSVEERTDYKGPSSSQMIQDDLSFQQMCSFRTNYQAPPPCYPVGQLKEMKPIGIQDFKNDERRYDDETERRNIMGLPSNYVLMTVKNFGRQPKVVVQLNGISIIAILDSGSSATIIAEEILNPAELLNMTATEQILRSMSKDALNIIGLIKAELCIGGRVINQNVLVMRDSPVLCLIGMDVLEQLDGVAMDLQTGNLINRPTGEIIHKAHEVYLNQDVTIPARHEMVYYANTTSKSEEEFLFEPNENLIEKHELPICSGLVTISDQTVPVRFVNFSDKPLKLKAKTNIGKITPVQEVSNENIPPQVKRYDKPRVESKILTSRQKQEMNQLLDKYECIFAKHEYDLGRTHVIEHEIPLTDPTPIKQRAYKIPYAYQGEVTRQIDMMLKHKILRPSFSPWSSPIVPVKKKSGELRLCVDYRKLNSVTRKDTYPLPIPQEIFDKINRSTIISVIDLISGYEQIGVAEAHKKLTACTDGRGLYEFNVLPFGLTGAPAIFQRTMNYVLMDLDHTLVYIDDIIVFSKSFKEHLSDLEMVFKRLKLAKLKIKPAKCEWAKDSVIYVGHVISKDGIKPDPNNINKVKKFPVPRTVKQVRQFIGLAGYYRRFIQNFAKIAEPLNKLLRFENQFKWGQEQQQAFDILKEKLISEPILRHPDMTKPFILMTDASNYAIGAVLGQKEKGEKDHVVAYASRQLNKHEKNYSTIEKEALAIVFAVQTYRHYLIGRKIYLYTDHSPLQWLMTHRNTASRLIRWALSLQEFDIEIRYRKGKANANADALSRIVENDIEQENTVLAIIRQSNNVNNFQKQQQNDKELNGIIKRSTVVKNNQEISQLIKDKQKYFIHDGILKCIIGVNVVTVVPENLRQAIMLQYHDGTLGGHLSARKTMSRIKTKYYWKTMEQDIKEWCRTCETCITRKNTGTKIKVPLKPMPVPLAPMEMTAMDVVGPLPETVNGNKYILVFCDYLTKWPEAFAMPDQKAETIAQIFVENIVFRYGTPKKLLTDRGTNFMSDLFKAITELFHILKLTTSPYHPQTDGLVERFNGTLINMLASYTNRKQKDWDLFINPCLYAYRNCVHTSTGETPFYLMYLRRNNMPMDLNFQSANTQYMDVPDYKTVITERMKIAWKQAGLNIRHQQENYKSQYDKNTKHHGINIGDLVYLNKPEPKKGLSPKLQRPFKGPYVVCGTTDTNLQLKPLKNKKAEPIIVHANRCKKVSEVDTSRYPLRSKQKVSDETVVKFTIKTKPNLNLVLLIMLTSICICSINTQELNIKNNTIVKFMQRMSIYPKYSMILWYFNGDSNEICLIRNLNSSDKIMATDYKNKKIIFRNLKTSRYYNFQIQHVIIENNKRIQTQIKIDVQTKTITNMVEIEPLENEIHVYWNPMKQLKVNIEFHGMNAVFIDTLNNVKRVVKYRNLTRDMAYPIIIMYMERYIDDQFKISPKKWITLLTDWHTVRLTTESNKVKIETNVHSIKVYVKPNKDKQVIIMCQGNQQNKTIILNNHQNKYEFNNLISEKIYFVKIKYNLWDHELKLWQLYLVQNEYVKTLKSSYINKMQTAHFVHGNKSNLDKNHIYHYTTTTTNVAEDSVFIQIFIPFAVVTSFGTFVLIVILCLKLMSNCDLIYNRMASQRTNRCIMMTQV